MNAARCENCGAAVAARFCGECGQRVDSHDLSLRPFLREATDEITNVDSRVWRTLAPLLFRPGFLTREFLDGRRARYLPPVRLYLILSVVCFVMASALGPSAPLVAAAPAQEAPTANMCDLRYDGPLWQQALPLMQAGCRAVVADGGRALTRQFVASLPGALFVSLPLLALVMKAMYWRPRRYYVEHLLFFVHIHSFLFAAVAMLMVLRHFLAGRAGTLLMFAAVAYGAWYLYRAMVNVYRQRRWLTVVKFSALSVAYLVGGFLLLCVTFIYSFVTLSIANAS